MKSFEQLRDEQLALPPLVPVLREGLRTIPGVVGVGIGFRTRGGQLTDEITFTVTVEHKRPLHDLPRVQQIPPTVDGIPIDVREQLLWTPTADFYDEEALDGDPLARLRGGASIIHEDDEMSRGGIDRGTLGCFARLRSDPSVVVLLTAHHVLYKKVTDKGPGMLVGQPRVSSTRCCKSHVIARTLDGVRGPVADAAIAKLNEKRPWVQLLPGIGPDKNGKNADLIVGVPQEVDVGGIKTAVLCGETVRKLGRNTGVTTGQVISIDAALESPDRITGDVISYDHQVLIKPTKGGVDDDGKLNFCVEGDSGSVVINQYNQVVGLLHIAGEITQHQLDNNAPCPGATVSANAFQYGGAAPIHAVLDALKIDIIPSKGINSSSTPASPVVPTAALVPGSGLELRAMTVEEMKRSRSLDLIIDELITTPLGRTILKLYERHGPEARNLLDHDRRTKIAWHRNHGPALAGRLMSGLTTLDQPIPQEIGGKPVAEVLRTVTSVFVERGSAAFAEDGRRYLPLAFELLAGATTLRELLDRVRAYGDATP